MTESQERFVRAIVDRLPVERVADMYVFPPLRQGGVETGVAVIAGRRDAPAAAPDESPDAPDESADEPVAERFTVYTARYRLAIRGPERGKWEFDLVEEADAPLVTVDAVVRGVQDRASEGGDPDRLGPDALAALLAPAPWTTAAR